MYYAHTSVHNQTIEHVTRIPYSSIINTVSSQNYCLIKHRVQGRFRDHRNKNKDVSGHLIPLPMTELGIK